jgi:hypothetical protein
MGLFLALQNRYYNSKIYKCLIYPVSLKGRISITKESAGFPAAVASFKGAEFI